MTVLEEDVEPGEAVVRIAVGLLNGSAFQQAGILVLTDRRIMFIHAGIAQSLQISVPLDTVTGVAVSKGPLYSIIKATGPQSNVVVGRVNKIDAEAFASELRALLTNRVQGPLQVPGRTGGDLAEALERLAALRDRGILTEQEFAAQKSKILGRVV